MCTGAKSWVKYLHKPERFKLFLAHMLLITRSPKYVNESVHIYHHYLESFQSKLAFPIVYLWGDKSTHLSIQTTLSVNFKIDCVWLAVSKLKLLPARFINVACSLAFLTNLVQELSYTLREPQFLNYHVRTNYLHSSTERSVNLDLGRLIS